MKYRALHAISWWNVYYILVLLLTLSNLIEFRPLPNIILLAALCLPLKWRYLHYLRQVICIAAGLALLYSQSYLPSLDAFSANAAGVTDFSLSFVLDFILSMINWSYVAVVAAVILAFLVLQDYLRFTTLSICGIAYLCAAPYISLLQPSESPEMLTAQQGIDSLGQMPVQEQITQAGHSSLVQSGPASPEGAAAFTAEFFAYEKARRVEFPSQIDAQDVPFDIILLNICSLSRSDLETAGLSGHPLFADADITFSAFNSATSYSGPATLRLLRSACGQSEFSGLYSQNSECELFSRLEHLGFVPQLYMDHSGRFGNYLQGLRDYAGFTAALSSQRDCRERYYSFDGEPVFADQDIFSTYLKDRSAHPQSRSAALFNLVSLHDGNEAADGSDKGLNHNERWGRRAQLLLDEAAAFEAKIKASGRPTLLIFVPEHGAALTGDKIQMARLRDIPSPLITNIPVFAKFFNVQEPAGAPAKVPVTIDYPTSYQALAELVSRAVSTNYFSGGTALQDLTDDLAPTYLVSENEGALVVRFQNTDFLRLKGRDFTLYPR